MIQARATVFVTLILLPWLVSSPFQAAAEPGAGDPPTSIGALEAGRLERALERYRALAEAGEWPRLPAGPTIRPGSPDPRLEMLRRRLALSGDLAVDAISLTTSEYDQPLQEAVRRFQFRHGLEVDGLVGRATLRALNVSIDTRIDQIRVNLERMRRWSDSLAGDSVLVNIAAFKAYVIRGGEIVWTTKVIVGEADAETPEFRSTMQQVVFNPTWTVPFSIASEEMLPEIKHDVGFFEKGGYQLYDRDNNSIDPTSVDWSVVSKSNFPFILVQRPGPANQLGEIKFLIPNKYSVCMHDTPSRALFARAARAFSHGCIRVEEPLRLAEVILANEGWTKEKIDLQIASGETRTVSLAEPLPVYILYWTVEVDDTGTVHFYDDIYGRDVKILKDLNESHPDSASQ